MSRAARRQEGVTTAYQSPDTKHWAEAGYRECKRCRVWVHPNSAPPFKCGQDCDTPGSEAVWLREEEGRSASDLPADTVQSFEQARERVEALVGTGERITVYVVARHERTGVPFVYRYQGGAGRWVALREATVMDDALYRPAALPEEGASE